jgi:hypothetical protein
MTEVSVTPEVVGNVVEAQHIIRADVSLDTLRNWQNPDYIIHAEEPKFGMIILGEAHTDREARKKQLELIELVHPQFVLHEFLSGWIYDPVSKLFKKQSGRTFDEFIDNDLVETASRDLSDLIEQSEKLGYKVVGDDLTFAEQDAVIEQLYDKDPLLRNYQDIGLVPGSPQLDAYRDQQMAKTIQEYATHATKPVIVILGRGHSEPLHQEGMIKQQGIQYAYVDQTPGYYRQQHLRTVK